jgi:hypothetical protein
MSWPVAPTKAEAYGVLLFREPARSLLGPEWCSIVLVSELELKEYRLLGCDDASVGGVKPEVIVDQTKPLLFENAYLFSLDSDSIKACRVQA